MSKRTTAGANQDSEAAAPRGRKNQKSGHPVCTRPCCLSGQGPARIPLTPQLLVRGGASQMLRAPSPLGILVMRVLVQEVWGRLESALLTRSLPGPAAVCHRAQLDPLPPSLQPSTILSPYQAVGQLLCWHPQALSYSGDVAASLCLHVLRVQPVGPKLLAQGQGTLRTASVCVLFILCPVPGTGSETEPGRGWEAVCSETNSPNSCAQRGN